MRVAIIVLAAAAVALGSTASADPYKDFAARERLAKPTYHRQRVFAQLGG